MKAIWEFFILFLQLSASLKLCQNKTLKNKQKSLFRNSKASIDPLFLLFPSRRKREARTAGVAAEGPDQGFRGKKTWGHATRLLK